jgi:hypothetical protein
MEQVQTFLIGVWDYAKNGFDLVNDGGRGLLIALAATVFLRSWNHWLPVSALAALVHIMVGHIAPVLAGQEAFKLPEFLDLPFWQVFGALFIGYLVIIAVFFFVKRLIVKPSAGGKPAKAHK